MLKQKHSLSTRTRTHLLLWPESVLVSMWWESPGILLRRTFGKFDAWSLETSVNRWCASGACARTALFADAAKYATQLFCLLVWQRVRDPAVSSAVNHMLSRNKLWSIVAHLVGNVSGACLCKTLPHNGMERWAVAGVLLWFWRHSSS